MCDCLEVGKSEYFMTRTAITAKNSVRDLPRGFCCVEPSRDVSRSQFTPNLSPACRKVGGVDTFRAMLAKPRKEEPLRSC